MSVLIDKAAEYIEAKDARYLAKEGLIVYYMSATGRKSDQVWVKHSMAETIRIIRATRLTTDCELRDHPVLAMALLKGFSTTLSTLALALATK